VIIYTHELGMIPGKIINEPNILYDKDLIPHKDVIFKIIKEVTIKEYIEYCEQEGVANKINYPELINATFYEIHMD
jgi:hypothetical protein